MTPLAVLSQTQVVLGRTVQLVFSNRLKLLNATLVVLAGGDYNSSVVLYGSLDPSSFFRVRSGLSLDFSGSSSFYMCGCRIAITGCAFVRELSTCPDCPKDDIPGQTLPMTSCGSASGIGIAIDIGSGCSAPSCNCLPTEYCTVFDTCELRPQETSSQGGDSATETASNVTNGQVSGSVGPSPTNRELSGGEIAGIAIGAVVGVALVVAIIVGLVLMARKQNRVMFLVKKKLEA